MLRKVTARGPEKYQKKVGLDFYPRYGFDPRFDSDPIRKSGYLEGTNPDLDSKMLNLSKLDLDPNILIF